MPVMKLSFDMCARVGSFGGCVLMARPRSPIQLSLEAVRTKNGEEVTAPSMEHMNALIHGEGGSVPLINRTGKFIIGAFLRKGFNQGGPFCSMVKSMVMNGLAKCALVLNSEAIGISKLIVPFCDGTQTADNITNVLKIECDSRPGAIGSRTGIARTKACMVRISLSGRGEAHGHESVLIWIQVSAVLTASSYLTK